MKTRDAVANDGIPGRLWQERTVFEKQIRDAGAAHAAGSSDELMSAALPSEAAACFFPRSCRFFALASRDRRI